MKFIIMPAIANKAKSWSVSPGCNKVTKSHTQKGIPIICPLRMISRYEMIASNRYVLCCFNLTFD
ncbi:hypothetical protein [Ferruginibacter sp. SUN106]|uniref:hypothetical protein n=1 Tax=Ferruginibacter sp. SUN106 TaxID=2978348 RepID=UPI003D35B504